jgi:hypothetical protein
MSDLAPVLKPARWRLSLAASDLPWLHRLGVALILASVAMLVSWCMAVWLDAWRHRSVGWSEPFALCLCALGLRHGWQLWRSWRSPAASVTLRWTGPVHVVRSGMPAGGWRVDEWGDSPVNVSLVWDWQRLMLLCLRSAGTEPQKAWVWLQDHPPDGSGAGAGVHRLRTLLRLPPSLTESIDGARSRHAGVMASSMHAPPTRSAPRMNQRDLPLTTPLRVEDHFPATEILERWPEDADDLADPARGGA